MPSRTAVPGAIISSARTSRGSCLASSSETSSPAYGIPRIVRDCWEKGFAVRDNGLIPPPCEGSGGAAGRRVRRAPPRSALPTVGQALARRQRRRSRPNLRASASRRSGWATWRSSPVRPISPKAASGRLAVTAERDAPFAADAIASAIARSAPGSSTRTPPATTRRRRRVPIDDAGVARQHRQHERQAVAVDAVGHPSRRHQLGRARRAPGPRPAADASPPSRRGSTEPGLPRVASATKRAEASSTSTRPVVAHLEDADLVGRPEAVLQRAQRPVGALALALEREHAVDEVLEHARTGERALLGDVADQHDRDAARLGDAHQAPGDLAHLPDRSRRPGQPGRMQRLDRVDDADVGALGLDRRDDRLEVGLGDDRDRQRGRAEPLGAQPHLGGRLLAGDVEDAAPGPRRALARGSRAPS